MEEDNYKVNLATTIPKIQEEFDVVLHAAGKAHMVPKTERVRRKLFLISTFKVQ